MDGARVDAAGGTSSARRRRERRLRSMLRHERRAVAMALAQALHHSSGLKVMERAQHARPTGPGDRHQSRCGRSCSSDRIRGSSTCCGFFCSQSTVTFLPTLRLPLLLASTLTLLVWCTRNFPVLLWRVLRHGLLVHFLLVKCPLLLASTLTLLVWCTRIFSSSAVESSASQVVGSLPLGEVFAAPRVYSSPSGTARWR